MSQFDVALLLGALSASFVWWACSAHLRGDRREDGALCAGRGARRAPAAVATAVF